ncbi:MAG TPA: low molecular weight protein-tyrosine-phosphatase [Saprospiraceae bacterium]|nr:low molecular weight protein-tyrosine-phosphatase [Saprospiraceae bacterium]
MKILIVCLGNICRSPMAEGILRHLSRKENLDWQIDSAGTGSWHIGEQPDPRAIAVCAGRGIDIRNQRARQFRHTDLDQFDLILTMDNDNHSQVISMTNSLEHRLKVRRIMSFSTTPEDNVPDPYFDGSFEEVYDLLLEVCARIIEDMVNGNR